MGRRKKNGSKCDIPLSEGYRIERFFFLIYFSSGEKLPVYHGSSHPVHNEEFPRQVNEFRTVSTDKAVTSSDVAEKLMPAEVI
jgi:hypothetical protein